MKIFVLILIIISFFIAPVFVFADCTKSGTTVLFINGMFTFSKDQADDSKRDLKYQYDLKGKNADVNFILGYNPSHIVVLGDMFDAVRQAYSGGFMDYDLTNILRQAHIDLKTQKVLLVGHSQGTFYTNAAYDYLTSHGVDKNSIAVYNVGTPADTVAGDGKYLTSSTDKVINSVVRDLTTLGFAKKPLPANIDLPLSADESANPLGGHDFSNVYLAEAPDRIISDMDSEINNLQAESSDKSECFTQPKVGLGFYIEDEGYTNIDTSISYFESPDSWRIKSPSELLSSAYGLSKDIYDFGKSIFSGVGHVFASIDSRIFTTSITPSYAIQESPGTGEATTIYVPPDSEPQPTVSAPAPANPIVSTNTEEQDLNPATPESRQDLLDDIQEKLDIIKAQIQILAAQEGQSNQIVVADKNETPEDNQNQDNSQTTNSTTATVSGGGGGATAYPKILISEVQPNDTQEFVELYNPNNTDVALDGWYLQRKTAGSSTWATFASNNLFTGKTISKNGYFLIARSGYFYGPANIFVDTAITKDNSFALKNPNGDISDKLGFGNAQDPETASAPNPTVSGQSVGRKVLADGTEQDTDNNLNDFELQNPTPYAQNETYTPEGGGGDNGGGVGNQNGADTVAPEVVFNLSSTQANPDFMVNFTITDLAGAVSPSAGVDGYVFRWKEGSGDWQQDDYKDVDGNPQFATLSRDFSGINGQTYSFQVQATDAAGNKSDWLPAIPATTQVVVLQNILINEIQIDSVDGAGGTSDDWVELYNPNNVDVSLAGWSIQKNGYSKTNCSVNTSFYSKQFASDAVIPANGFYLVVSTKANSSLLALADMTIGWSLTDNNTIYLVNNTDQITDYKDVNIVDEVGYGTACFSKGDSPAIAPPDAGSIERKKLGVDTNNNFADFKISVDPTPKAASPKSYIQDATNYATCMTITNPGTTFYNLDIKWSSLTTNLDHYQVQYNLNGGAWQDWETSTTDTEKTFQTAYSLYLDKIYTFRVRAYDKDGNVGDWSQVVIDLTNPVVINEVAFYGIGDSTAEHKQWMELYNRSSAPIVLDGWQIVSDNINYLNVTLQGTIPANGYFILERNDTTPGAVSDVLANQTFAGIITTGDTIYLKNQNNRKMDQFRSDWSQNQFLANSNYYSLERISPYSFGQDLENWRLSTSPTFGTPNQQNSIYQIYTSNFTNSFVEDTTLKASLSPYLFEGPTYILPGVTLTIEPGTVIKFYGDHPNLTVDGTLKAVGATTDQPIVFTAYDDDQYGGDMRPSGDTSPAGPGEWAGILFKQDSANSDLENIIERYAGENIYAEGYGAGIRAEQSSITLKNSVVENNLNAGLFMHNSTSTVDSVQFNNNKEIDSDTIYGKAVFSEDGSPSITNCKFNGNYDALYLTNANSDDNTPVISNNNFDSNTDSAISVNGKDIYPIFSGNTATNNGYDAIVFTEQIEKDMTMQNDLPYLIKETLNIPQNITLTIQPGTVVKFADSSFNVDGTLNAVGTDSQQIVFTSVDDDNYGGDIRSPSDTSPVQPGQWSGIHFNSDSANSDLENIIVRYGGGSLGGNFSAAIKVDQSTISLKNSTIQNNAQNGVWLVNSPSVIDSVQFLDNKAINGANPVSGLNIEEGVRKLEIRILMTMTMVFI